MAGICHLGLRWTKKPANLRFRTPRSSACRCGWRRTRKNGSTVCRRDEVPVDEVRAVDATLSAQVHPNVLADVTERDASRVVRPLPARHTRLPARRRAGRHATQVPVSQAAIRSGLPTVAERPTRCTSCSEIAVRRSSTRIICAPRSVLSAGDCGRLYEAVSAPEPRPSGNYCITNSDSSIDVVERVTWSKARQEIPTLRTSDTGTLPKSNTRVLPACTVPEPRGPTVRV